jgi:hypothetical protein
LSRPRIYRQLIGFFTFESDFADGGKDAEVDNDPIEVHEKALKMGANTMNYIFNH